MNIEGMLRELGCDVRKKEDIHKKSEILIEIFNFCEKLKIVIQDNAEVRRSGNSLRFYPRGRVQGDYISAEIVGNRVKNILEGNKKQGM